VDLLSLVGIATKRRGDYFDQAKSLATKYKTLDRLEEQMAKESKAVVKGLRDRQMRFEEYERTMVDKTITAALAAVYLATENQNPKAKMEKAWPTVVGDMLPPLTTFLNETKQAIDNGSLRQGDTTVDFAEGGVSSWPGLLGRVIRYIANPAYSFFNLGDNYVKQEQGYKEMRRVPLVDAKVCPDCVAFGNAGWQPMGTLPMPGRDCQCYDRCRCRIEYR